MTDTAGTVPSKNEELVEKFLERVIGGQSGKNLGVPISLDNVNQWLHGVQQARYYLMGADSGVGKCLGLGTRIIMYDGTLKNVEDVVRGDKLMGPDGKVRNVLSICTGKEQMYWIRQKRGIDYRVNESHILSLRYKPNDTWSTAIKPGQANVAKNKRKREYKRTGRTDSTISNMSVKDYLNVPNKLLYNGWKSPVSFKGSDTLKLPPYLIGLWLGDGTSSKPEITTNDREIVEYIYDTAKDLGMRVTQRGKFSYNIVGANRGDVNQFTEELRRLGILNNKHVPYSIVTANKTAKLQFIAGLIDSDGYHDWHNGMVEITQKRKDLAEGIVFVLRSLGFYTTLKSKLAIMKRKDGSIYSCTCYKIGFPNSPKIPCKIARKVARKDGLLKPLNTAIKVEKDVIDNYYGFVIDGDHLFLLEDFTVTHNTSLGDFIFLLSLWLVAKKTGKKIRCLYYSFELSGEEKIAAWTAYFISEVFGVSLPVDYILGYIHGNMVTDEHLELIRKASSIVNEMLQNVTIHDSPKNPTAIYHDAIDLAEELGTVVRETKVSKRLKDKDGKAMKQVYITGYIPDDPDMLVMIILDHVALATPEAGLSPKATIDRMSSYFVFIRNKFRFSILLIQQFNTEMQTVERRKFSQAAFAPQRSDFGDSKYTYRDADVVFGLIKPSFFDLQSYFGFQIEPTSGVTYGLGDTFVAAFLMKNRYGPTNKMMPLFMDGITKRFYDLPLDPSDPNEMEEFSAMNDKIKELCLLYSQPRK